jgi:uncharacterized protein YaiE (UPF0345 family)
MSSFDQVSVTRLGNSYFDGKVTSRTLHFPDGSKKTLGFMQPGEYRFSTGQAERMEIQQGTLKVRLKEAAEWQTIVSGQSFEVPANSHFDLQVLTLTDYCCHYL